MDESMTTLAAWLAPGLDRIEQAVAAHALVVLELKRQPRKQARFVPSASCPLERDDADKNA